jgi:WD40 repeat protein
VAYDAFISYSQSADRRIAEALQSALHRIAKPWYRLRALRIFRDASSLAASPDLPTALEQALSQSRFLVLCASPQSAASPWVRQELAFWRENKASDHLLLVLTAGEIVWDSACGGFDWKLSTALPRELEGMFQQEPLWIDMRSLKSSDVLSLRSLDFRDKAVTLAAALHGKPKDTLDSEDVRQHRRTLRVAWGGGTALAALLAVAAGTGWVAMEERKQKEHQREMATARRLTLSSASIPKQNAESQQLKALLAMEATRRFDALSERSFDADTALRSALALYPTRVKRFTVDSILYALAIDPQGRILTAAGGGLKVRRWDLASGKTLYSHDERRQHLGLALSSDGNFLAIVGADNQIDVRDLHSDKRIAGPLTGAMPIALGPGGQLLAVNDPAAGAWVWEVKTGKRIDTKNKALKLSTNDVLKFSPSGRYLATTGGFPAGVWALRQRDATRYIDRRPRPNFDNPTALAFSPGGRYLLEARQDDDNFHLYRFPLRSESGAVRLGKGMQTIAAGPGGRLLAGADRRQVRIAEPASGYRGVIDIRKPITQLAFTPQETLILGGKYGDISVWKLEHLGRRTEISEQGKLLALHLAGDGALLRVTLPSKTPSSGSGSAQPQLQHSPPHEAAVPEELPLSPGVTAAAFSADGRYVALYDTLSSSIHIRETISGKPRATLAADIGSDMIFSLNRDGRYLITANSERVRILDMDGGAVVEERAIEGTPVALVLGDKRRWLLIKNNRHINAGTRGDRKDTEYLLLDLATPGKVPMQLDIATYGLPRFGPRGRYLAWTDTLGKTVLCELDVQGCGSRSSFEGEFGAFSGDGRFLALHDGHGATTIWDIEHQQRIAQVRHPCPATQAT